MRPLSYYATPGARAFGSLGTVPDDVDAYGGLTIGEYALMPNGRILEPATFTQAQYKNQKWGDEPEVTVFLVLAILYLEEKPDVVIVYGYWCNDKDGENSNFSLFYNTKELSRDKITRDTVEAMPEDELILDVNWPDTIRLPDIDPSVIVVSTSARRKDADPDIKVVSAVARQIRYGKKKTKSFIRVEALPTDDTYTMEALMAAVPKPAWLVLPMRRMGPSGIAPQHPAFRPVPADAFFHAGKVFLVGADAGGLACGATWREEEGGDIKFGVFGGGTTYTLGNNVCTSMMQCMNYNEGDVHDMPMILALQVTPVAVASLIDPVLFAGEASYRLAKLDESGGVVRKLTHVKRQLLPTEAIMDVATDQMVFEQLKRFHESLHPGAAVTMCRALRNEARLQLGPAFDADFTRARVVVRAVELMRCSCIPGALEFVWAGDRANTLTKTLDARELTAILDKMGWVVPEKESRVGSRKAPRRERCVHRPPDGSCSLAGPPPRRFGH